MSKDRKVGKLLKKISEDVFGMEYVCEPTENGIIYDNQFYIDEADSENNIGFIRFLYYISFQIKGMQFYVYSHNSKLRVFLAYDSSNVDQLITCLKCFKNDERFYLYG